MPLSPQWAVSQLLSYSPLEWLAFVGVAASAAYWGRWRGMIGGQVLVAVLVSLFDADYYGHHTRQMDMDFVFGLGVFARTLLINCALLWVSGLALWLSYRKARASAV